MGAAIAALFSRGEAKRSKTEAIKAKDEATSAKEHVQTVQHTLQPNGQSLNDILSQLTLLMKQSNRLLLQLIRLERYTRRRNHSILNSLYRIALGNAAMLRKLGVDVPDPDPPLPDELIRNREEEGPLT